MEEENNLVRVESESGEFLDMLILKEFDFKSKKYAVLMEVDSCNCGDDCDCDESCECEDGCNCDESCECEDGCNCDESCECGCQEDKECTCHGECGKDKALCLLEITKDKDDNEIFKSIDDEKLYNELVDEAEKVLYED